jgi:enamine deaminase RidA (YjgF/YER057c/UK114 family)
VASAPGGQRLSMADYVTGGGAHEGGDRCRRGLMLAILYGHARLVGLDLLAVVREAAGSLDTVEVIKLLGMVNAVPEFADHGKVIDGCSDLLVAVLGEAGRHARASVGMGSLPGQITVEIEAVVRLLP